MKARITVVCAAALLTITPLTLTVNAQVQKAVGAPDVTASAAMAKAPIAANPPTEWIEYEDATYTPVLDEVSRKLAEVRAALLRKDNAKAAESMQAAARALTAQADRVAKTERQRATADIKLARDTQTRLGLLVKKLNATALQMKTGSITTSAQLDKVLDKAARADLERRWMVTDATTWYPVTEEPQRHFTAAADAFAKKDYKIAANEVRKATSYIRLESARAAGDVKAGLDAVGVELGKTARALDKGTIKTEKDLDKAFADANHALALAHREQATRSWAAKSYDRAGYELKAAAYDLGIAAKWAGGEVKAGTASAITDARVVGDKLASGGVWAKDEVAKGFESLGNALNNLGMEIGSKYKATRFNVSA